MRKIAALWALVFSMTSCWFSHPHADPSSFTVVAVAGDANVKGANGAQTVLLEKAKAPIGSVITVGNGSVTLSRGDSTLELRPVAGGSQSSLTLTSLEQVDVSSGALLATIKQNAPVAVVSQGVSATAGGDATFRFDRELSVRVGVYAGSVEVSTAEGTLTIEAYSEAVIAGRVLPRTPTPYTIDTTDPWDAKLLADVIALDGALSTQTLGYERQVGTRFRSMSELAPVARDAGRSVDFVSPFLGSLSSGDLIAGLELSLLAARLKKTDPGAEFREFLTLFNQNATWGLLARANNVSANDLRRAVERTIAILLGEVRPGPTPSPTPTPSPSATPSRSASPSPTPTHTKPPPPPPPGGLGAPSHLQAANGACQVLQAATVNLTWTASSSSDAGGYEIFRSPGGGQFTSIGSVDGRDHTSFTDNAVEFSKAYSYRVWTRKGTVHSAFSNTATITTQDNLCM